MKTRNVRRLALLGVVVVATTGCTWFQQVSAVPTAAAHGAADRPALSADGRYVAYTAPSTTNPSIDVVYRLDTTNGTRALVSVAATGGTPNDWSGEPSISGDGRFIAFSSDADDLIAGDTNSETDVFLRDLVIGTTQRISTETNGTELFYPSYAPAISADATIIAFISEADELSTKDTNLESDAYVFDRARNTMTLASILNNVQTDFGVSQIALSSNGKVVAYTTDTDLASGDENSSDDVYVRILSTGYTQWASKPKSADPSEGGGTDPSLSADGRFVAFTGGSDIDGVGTPGPQVFVRDLNNLAVTRVSMTDAGAFVPGGSSDPVLSGDGRRLSYTSTSSPTTDANGTVADVFVKDLDRNRTRVVSTDWLLNQRSSPAFAGSISPDGHYVAFASAGQFGLGDTNSVVDAFVRSVDIPTIKTITPTTAARGGTVTFTVTGTGFIPGAAGISIDNLFTAVSATYVSDSQVTVTLKIAANAPTGPTNFYVVNPGTGPGLTTGALSRCVNCLTIT